MNATINNFLTNKWVLYFISFLAFFNIIGYLVIGNTNVAIYFFMFAALISFFSKNMTIILGVPLFIINVIALKDVNMTEGMENNEQQIIDKIVKDNKDKPDQKSSQGLPMHPLEDMSSETVEQQGFETGRRKYRGNNIDFPATVQDAYEELDNVFESNGIVADTSHLAKQQIQLAKAVENMKPMLN